MLDFEKTTDNLRKQKKEDNRTAKLRGKANDENSDSDKIPVYLAIVLPDAKKSMMKILESGIEQIKTKFSQENKFLLSNCDSLLKLAQTGNQQPDNWKFA